MYTSAISLAQGSSAEISPDSRVDLPVGCYPCQGYSQVGSRDWDASLNFLYRQFDRVLRIVRPKAFIVENVNGMAFGDNREAPLFLYPGKGARLAVRAPSESLGTEGQR
jgi:site-specific DNA-cytosine methylase